MATFSPLELVIQLGACRICTVFVYRMMTSRTSMQDGIRQIARFRTTSDSVGDVRERIKLRSRDAKLSKIKKNCQTTY